MKISAARLRGFAGIACLFISARLFAQTASTASLPSPLSQSIAVVGPTGDVYETYAASMASGNILEVVRASPTHQVRWSQSLVIGQAPTPGGIAVDPNGNAYVSVNDMPNSASALVKLGANGVFVSSTVPPYNGASFSPLIADVDLDTATSRLYTIQTVVDPNSNGQARVLVLDYDWNLKIQAAKLLSDASWIADEANGLRVDSGKDVRVGVTEYAAGSQMPSYEIETLNPTLTQTLSVATTSQILDFIELVACMTQGPTTGQMNMPLSAPLSFTIADTLFGTPIVGQTIGFSYGLVPGEGTANQATGYSLTVTSTQTDTTGTASTLPTLGNLPGLYQINTAFIHANMNCYVGTTSFDVVAATAQPQISISTGDQQIGFVKQPLATPLTSQVQLITQGPPISSSPVLGASVSFAVSVPTAPYGQSLSVTSATTNQNGLASTVLTLSSVPVDHSVVATCPACVAPSTATFHACARLGAPGAGGIDVDYLNQGSPPWGTTQYNEHVGTTIQNLGCALTSMAMVTRYVGVALGADGNPINPGNLNLWLDDNGGYNNTHDVDFTTISTYTAGAIYNDGVPYESTEYNGANSPAELTAMIATDLQNGLPVVVETQNPTTGHHPHFIVVTGLCGLPNQGGYLVSDPGNHASSNWNFTSSQSGSVLSYTLRGIRRFTRTP